MKDRKEYLDILHQKECEVLYECTKKVHNGCRGRCSICDLGSIKSALYNNIYKGMLRDAND